MVIDPGSGTRDPNGTRIPEHEVITGSQPT